MKKILFAVFIFIIIIAIAGGLVWSVWNYFIKDNSSIVPAFSENEAKLIIEGELVTSSQPPIFDEGEVLLSANIIKKYFDPYLFWDEKEKKVTITTKNKLIRMKTGSLEVYVNDKPIELNIPARLEGKDLYIPIGFLTEYYDIEITVIETRNMVIIDRQNSVVQVARPISNGAGIRTGMTRKHPSVAVFDGEEAWLEAGDDMSVIVETDIIDNSGNAETTNETSDDIVIPPYLAPEAESPATLRVFEEFEKWYRVRTKEGILGYIEKKDVAVSRIYVNRKSVIDTDKQQVWKPAAGKINLVWEMMYSKRPKMSDIGKIEGLDVISPTWFQLKSDNGTLINRADPVYVKWAHDNGYRIWALLSNDFGDIDMTNRFLHNTTSRDNLIREILAYASLYELDGINIDFENIYKNDKDYLTQFVRELTPMLRQQGLVVSIDVTIPDGSDTWSLCFDRKALGEVVDYVMLMTYDQHWKSSPKAGSVAQITWVEKNLRKVLNQVPKDKLLLGLPFYTRLWKEEKQADGKIKVSNPEVLSMDKVRQMVSDNNAKVEWDDESGQFYTAFEKDGATYKIWIEDENSINLKSSLVLKYELAGAAAWRRSDEAKAVWEVLNVNLKKYAYYQEWKNAENSEYSFN